MVERAAKLVDTQHRAVGSLPLSPRIGTRRGPRARSIQVDPVASWNRRELIGDADLARAARDAGAIDARQWQRRCRQIIHARMNLTDRWSAAQNKGDATKRGTSMSATGLEVFD